MKNTTTFGAFIEIMPGHGGSLPHLRAAGGSHGEDGGRGEEGRHRARSSSSRSTRRGACGSPGRPRSPRRPRPPTGTAGTPGTPPRRNRSRCHRCVPRTSKRGHGHPPVPSDSLPAPRAWKHAGADAMLETRLDNGLLVLSERIPGVRSAAVGVWVRQGAAHERPEADRSEPPPRAHGVQGHGKAFRAARSRSRPGGARRLAGRLHEPGAHLVSGAGPRRAPAGGPRRPLGPRAGSPARSRGPAARAGGGARGDRPGRGHAGRPRLRAARGPALAGAPLRLVHSGHEGIRGESAMRSDALRAVHEERYVGSNMLVAAAGSVDHDAFVARVAEHFESVAEGRAGCARDRPRTDRARAGGGGSRDGPDPPRVRHGHTGARAPGPVRPHPAFLRTRGRHELAPLPAGPGGAGALLLRLHLPELLRRGGDGRRLRRHPPGLRGGSLRRRAGGVRPGRGSGPPGGASSSGSSSR